MRNNSSLAEVVKGVLTSTTDDITPLVRLVFADEYEAVPQPFMLGSDTSSTAHHTGTTSHPAASEDREAQARSTLESMLEMLADLAETKEQEVHQLHKCVRRQPNGTYSLCLQHHTCSQAIEPSSLPQEDTMSALGHITPALAHSHPPWPHAHTAAGHMRPPLPRPAASSSPCRRRLLPCA
jgi:hypothetical protein